MALLYKTVVVGQAWLTATMTLVAGMPHFSCACPDGTVKPICVNIPNHSSGCCCAGSCCSATAGATCCSKVKDRSEEEKKRPCCSSGDSHKQAGSFAVQRIAMNRPGCARTFAQPQATALAPFKTSIGRDCAGSVLLPSSTFDPNSRQAVTFGLGPRRTHTLSPPTDFLALFRHYVI